MKAHLRSVLRSGKFMVGFIIFASILLFSFIYPFFNPGNPLAMIGYNSFTKPGTYISLYDSMETRRTYIFRLPDAELARVASKLDDRDRGLIREWLILFNKQENAGIRESEIDIENTTSLLSLWWEFYTEDIRVEGLTIAGRRELSRLDQRLDGLFYTDDRHVMAYNQETGEHDILFAVITVDDYVHIDDIANSIHLPLGTDGFGRDMLKQLVSAIGTSLWIGLIAGCVATSIGLVLGLVAGYVGGIVDDIIMFFTNLFTVIPGFVLLILIANSMTQYERGPVTVAVVIGITSWVWTTRSVRSQVMSLRNRDHVNLSKLSGHSMPRIIAKDVLPYLASYVVMAFILQISSGILSEAGLSMLGLGPSTTTTATLGLMMDWSIMKSTAHITGAWWAYYPVIIVIALISFSLNLMNTGLDQVFNPQLRD
jgi:peptide/nickel transport system permease protein